VATPLPLASGHFGLRAAQRPDGTPWAAEFARAPAALRSDLDLGEPRAGLAPVL